MLKTCYFPFTHFNLLESDEISDDQDDDDESTLEELGDDLDDTHNREDLDDSIEDDGLDDSLEDEDDAEDVDMASEKRNTSEI